MPEESSMIQLISNFIQLTGGIREHIDLEAQIEKEDRIDLCETVQDIIHAIRALERTMDNVLIEVQTRATQDLPMYQHRSSMEESPFNSMTICRIMDHLRDQNGNL